MKDVLELRDELERIRDVQDRLRVLVEANRIGPLGLLLLTDDVQRIQSIGATLRWVLGELDEGMTIPEVVDRAAKHTELLESTP